MTAIRILLLAWVISSPAPACINVSGTSIEGGTAIGGGFAYAVVIRHSMRSSPAERFRDLIRYRSDKDDDEFTPRELQGVEDVYMGRYDEALGIFQEIEAASPGRYSTAANMGTAYELKGDLEPALKWITEGLQRNPDSHQGTEWLHQTILRAKIRLRQDPDLARGHIIELPGNLSRTSRISIDGRDYPAAAVSHALRYQLSERAYFVKPLDPVMADLLFTYGVLEAHIHAVEPAIKLLELSREYGYQDTNKLVETIGHYESLIRFRKIRFAAWILLGVLAFLGFLVFAYRKKWFS
jgi:tetratricopeptide (TPR) repeat protein